jgi:glycyl-radical enzyme activating protein
MTAIFVNIKRFAVHDGPGIRTTIFLKGCSLNCRWCHNPESISPGPELGLLRQKCIGCGKCVDVCPNVAHSISNCNHHFDRDKCKVCGKCVETCYSDALEYHGNEISVDEAEAAILEDKEFYVNSGGGCTLSGGEPLLQTEFCASLFKRLRQNGVHCAIDTSGAVPWHKFETVLPYTDMFLYDVKHIDDKCHREHTGTSNRLILSNLEKLMQYDIPVEIRIPVIPGFNADKKSLGSIGKWLSRFSDIVTVQLLPYHELARSKYVAVGHHDTMPHVSVPTPEQMCAAVAGLNKFGLNVKPQ